MRTGLKLTGLLFLFVSCCMLGSETEKQLKYQWKIWLELKEVFVYLEKEMICHRLPLPEAFRYAAKDRMKPIEKFLLQISKAAEKRDGNSLNEIWKEAFEEEIPAAVLKGDRKIVEEAVTAICAHDAITKKTLFERYIERMEVEVRQAYENWQEKGRLYRRLSVTGGALLVILLC